MTIALKDTYYCGSGVLRRNMYSSAVFTGWWPICTQLLPRQGCTPLTILSVRKLDTLCYPNVNSTCLCVPSFWHNTGVWRTDGRTDRRICCSIAAAFIYTGWANNGLILKVCNTRICWHTLWTEKHTKMFLSYLPQNPVDSDKIWYI